MKFFEGLFKVFEAAITGVCFALLPLLLLNSAVLFVAGVGCFFVQAPLLSRLISFVICILMSIVFLFLTRRGIDGPRLLSRDRILAASIVNFIAGLLNIFIFDNPYRVLGTLVLCAWAAYIGYRLYKKEWPYPSPVTTSEP